MARHGTIEAAGRPALLAIETAGLCGGVALVAEEQCLAEYSLLSRETHSRRLLASIERLMAGAGLDWDGIEAVAVSLGPGSFTGLRIGLATAKGLAMAVEKPLVGIPTLDAVAAQFFQCGHPVCVLADARKREVYAAFYRSLPDGGLERTSDFLLTKPAEVAGLISEPTVMVGDGLAVFRPLFEEMLGELLLPAPATTFFPRAAAVGRLAWQRCRRREFLDPAAAVPIYIRPSEAELHVDGIVCSAPPADDLAPRRYS